MRRVSPSQLCSRTLWIRKIRLSLADTLQKRVSDVQGAERVDLLPSSLDMIDVQDRLATAPMGQFYSMTPTDLLRLAVKGKLDDYDYVLIDCPPNLGIITLNGLRISEGYIIPTVPDVLSTYEIPQILKRVASFAQEIAEPLDPLGIVVTKYPGELYHPHERREATAARPGPP